MVATTVLVISSVFMKNMMPSFDRVTVKIIESGLSFFLFSFSFLFFIFRTLGLGLEVIGHAVTSVMSDGVITTLIMELKRKK